MGLDSHIGESFGEHAESLGELRVLVFKVIDECFDAMREGVGVWVSGEWLGLCLGEVIEGGLNFRGDGFEGFDGIGIEFFWVRELLVEGV